MLRWGNEGNVLIQAFVECERVTGIWVRIDVRNTDRESIDTLVALAKKLHCHFYVMETQNVIPPELKALIESLAKSRAVEFARDPSEFIDRFVREIKRQSAPLLLLTILLSVLETIASAEPPSLAAHPANVWIKRTPLPDAPVSPRLGYEGACVWDRQPQLSGYKSKSIN